MLKLLRDKLSLADIILIAALLAAAGFSARLYSQRQTRKQVYIHKDSKLIGIYPINSDRVLRLDEHNTVVIEDGKVRMLSADCPDKRCVRQGAGDTLPIICLPNRVVVEIRARDEERRLIVR